MRKSIFWSLAVILLFVIVGQFIVPCSFPATAAVTQSLEKTVPAAIHGWTVHSRPIAETEIMLQQVRNVLRYDEAVYRIYRSGTLEVTVYAAYWKPGTASYSQVGLHTPDTCWIYSGWHRDQREHGISLLVAGRPLVPAEIGKFTKNDVSLYVMFWHLVGGRPISYNETGWDASWRGKFHRIVVAMTDLARFGLRQRDDQCFVRVTSNRPLDETLRNADFQSLLARLDRLGVFASSAASSER